jgi:hypothetical protein
MNRKEKIRKILRESLVNVTRKEKPKPIITFDEDDVDYQIQSYDRIIHISGKIVPPTTGHVFVGFENDGIGGEEDEEYWNEHWELIIEQIINAYYDQL